VDLTQLFTVRQNFPVGVVEGVERLALLLQFGQFLVPCLGQETVNPHWPIQGQCLQMGHELFLSKYCQKLTYCMEQTFF
jgi:hypothetical protein